MNFEIETENTKKKKEKKKSQKIYMYLMFGLLGLTFLLLIIYFMQGGNSKGKETPKQPTQKEQQELVIVDEKSNQRPIAVVIDNAIGDIRHAGLQHSYINYEFIVEGGLTRILALYKDVEISIVGPVRSARDYFLDYALEHDAIFAHYGWSPQAEKDISSLKVDNINGMKDTAPFARDKNLQSPHNVFTSTKKIRDFLADKGYSNTTDNWKVLNYSIDEVSLEKQENVAQTNKVVIQYSNSEYRTYSYDNSNKYYLRSQNGKAQIDRKTEKQLNFKNIIIMKVENKSIDKEDRQSLTTVGTGKGYYITNGYAVPINWSKSSRTAKTKYTYENGEEIKVNDGNTFIQVVPLSGKITIE